MTNLEKWENLIKEKRKKTDFRVFLKEIASWSTLSLYRNNGKICRYPETGRIKNLDNKEFQNASSYFLEYDFSKGFFENFKNLYEIIPFQYLMDFGENENSEFIDQAFGVKNGYLSFVVGYGVENIVYSAFSYVNLKNIYNSVFISENCDNIFWVAGCDNSYNIFYSKYIKNSSNIWFSTNLIGCEECIFCNGLENQKYCFQNKSLKKEEYFQIKNEILKRKDKFFENYIFISKNEPINYLSENVNGKYNIKCENIEKGYWVKNLSNGRNVVNIGGENNKNFYDSFDVGINSENYYGVLSSGNNTKNLFSTMQVELSSNIYYSYFLKNCSFCIGCIGLKNKQFCILNKEYSKEEWYILADKIFSQMNNEGTLGDFFPGSLNPFYFNDTMAYLIDPSFTKEEVEKDNYLWRDDEIKVDIPKNVEIIKTKDLNNFQGYDSNGNWFINPEILTKVIKDENGNVYKIIKMEYDFLMKHSLPLPEIHWLERIKMGFNF